MLSKAKKVVMYIIGFVTILLGVVTCIPFRVIAANANIKDIFVVEGIVKLVVFPLVAILLVIFPNILKYRQIKNREERSKVVNLFSYLPIVILISSLLVLSLHTLTFEKYPMNNVAHSIMLVVTCCYLVLSLLLLPLLNGLTMKFARKHNYILDVVVLLILVIFDLLTWRILKTYADANIEGYVYGASQNDPYLFVLLIGLFFAVVLGAGKLVKIIKANETVVYASVLNDDQINDIIKEEYDRAYNDILDDFENYFDNEVIEEQSEPEVVEQSEPEVVEQSEPEVVEQPEPEVVEQLEPEVVEQADSNNQDESITSEVLEDLNDLHQLLEDTDSANDEKRAKEAENIRAQIEVEKNALADERNELEAYRSKMMAEIAELRAQVDEIEDEQDDKVEVAPVAKKKVFKPTFEQVVTFAKSLQEESWKISEKISEENGNGTIKFSKGKLQFLILQKTSSDYRITFMVTEKKWDTIYTTVKGISVPKNAKGNNVLKYVNKGIAETSLIKSFIRESVKAVNAEIARIEKEKEEEKKRKAEAKKLAKQQAKLAEENNK